MKRKIVFDGEKGTRRAGLLYMMFILGSANSERRTVDEARKEAKFFDSMDTIGALDQKNPNQIGVESFKLNNVGDEMMLEQAVHNVVVKYLEVAIGLVAPGLVRDAVNLLDWFNSAEKLEVD